MNTKTITPTEKHIAFRKSLEEAIRKSGQELQAEEILAITAHFVGQLVALQDQRKYTAEMVMTLVSENIEQGNKEAIEGLLNNTSGYA